MSSKRADCGASSDILNDSIRDPAMIKARPTFRPATAHSNANAAGIFLSPNGRLPGFAQRRLDDLLAKKQTEGLTRKEQQELSEALDYIDSKTIEMLEYGLMSTAPNKTSGSRGGAAVHRTKNGKA